MKGLRARHWLLASVAWAATALPASIAAAQTSPAEDQGQAASPAAEDSAASSAATQSDSEIVVTAQRRNMLLSEIPASLSVVSGEALTQSGINTISDLSGRLPSLTIGTGLGTARIAIRGVGFAPVRPGDEGRVAFYVDGVYIARPEAQLGSLFDVERLEVLRGPQGTLYGRNATGGALLLVTRDPTREVSGYLNATVGSYDLRQFSGALSGPISNSISARIAFETLDRSGYNYNAVTGNSVNDARTVAFRATILWRPSAQFSLRLSGDSFRQNDMSTQLIPLRPSGLLPATAPRQTIIYGGRTVYVASDPFSRSNIYGFSAIATYTPSDYLTLTAVGGSRRVDAAFRHLGSACVTGCSDSFSVNDATSYSVDVQLAGDGSRFDWIVGGSYLREDNSPTFRSAIEGRLFGNPNAPYLTQGTRSSADLSSDAKSVFVDGTFDIVEGLSVSGGVRYSWETKEALNNFSSLNTVIRWPDPTSSDYGFLLLPPQAGYPRDERASFSAWTPRFAIRYEITDDLSVYGNYTQGFKSGGFNYGTNQAAYSPETITSYEVGLSLAAFQRALTLRSAVFRYDYSGLQQTVLALIGTGTFVLNTGDARIQGVELEFVARPLEGLQIDGNGAILDSEFAPFIALHPNTRVVTDIGGNRVPQAPTYTLTIGAQYSFDTSMGEFTIRGDYRRQGKTYYEIFNEETVAQTAYGVLDANLMWESRDGHWNGSLFVRNISNTFASNQNTLGSNSLQAGVVGALIPPRTYGLRVGYNF